MTITYHGLSCFSLKSKSPSGEVVVVIDPYDNVTGLRFPRTLAGDLVVSSGNIDATGNVGAIQSINDQVPFVVNLPGEYEVKGVFVNSRQAPLKNGLREHRISRLQFEGVTIAHLGSLDRSLTDQELEELGDIDVLFVPVGGARVMTPKFATEVISQVDPRVVIPMAYALMNVKEPLESIEAFCKVLGVCQREDVKTLKLSRSGLPEDSQVVYVLEKS